jgi:hypothetical protein
MYGKRQGKIEGYLIIPFKISIAGQFSNNRGIILAGTLISR